MKKSLFALAIAGALVAPAAMADTSNVNIYGTIAVSFESFNNGNTNAATTNGTAGQAGASTNQISSNVSKIGFKGSEDLGDGLSAIWQIEQQINVDNTTQATGTGTFATRNTFAGLKSETMGTVLMGRHDTPYKISTRNLDVFADTAGDNRSLMGGSTGVANGGGAFDSRNTDVLAYISPSISGFTGAIAYVAGAELATNSAQTKGAAWSLAGMYSAGPLYASLGYQVHDYGSANTGNLAAFTAGDKLKATKLGVGYTLDALQLNAVWEKTSFNPATAGQVDTIGRTNWYVAGKYSFGNDAVKLAYSKAGQTSNSTAAAAGTQPAGFATDGANQWTLGYDHSLSKRTYVYALYSRIANDVNGRYTISNAGTTAGGQATNGGGANVSILSLGLKHSF